MSQINNYLKKLSHIGLISSLIKMASFFKVSFIVGSYVAFFSATSMIMPLTGLFGGIGSSSGVFFVSMIIRLLCIGSLPFKYLAYHIPGLFAAFYLGSSSWLVRLLVPIVCMVLFMMHPVGALAFPYALYWLIPVGLYWVKRKPFFLEALGSTFTAHAVGSVIWIYATPTSVVFWYGLLPVVLVERLLFATGMVLVCQFVQYAQKKLSLVDGYSLGFRTLLTRR